MATPNLYLWMFRLAVVYSMHLAHPDFETHPARGNVEHKIRNEKDDENKYHHCPPVIGRVVRKSIPGFG